MLAVKKILILCGVVGFLEEYIPVLLAWKDVREYLKKYIGEFYTIAATGILELIEICTASI